MRHLNHALWHLNLALYHLNSALRPLNPAFWSLNSALWHLNLAFQISNGLECDAIMLKKGPGTVYQRYDVEVAFGRANVGVAQKKQFLQMDESVARFVQNS